MPCMLIVNIDLRACCSRGRFVRAWNGDKCGFAINFIEDVRDMVVPHPLFFVSTRVLDVKTRKGFFLLLKSDVKET